MAPYALPDGYFYLDKAGAQKYAANGGTEVVLSEKVNATPGQVLDAWVKFVWLTGAKVLVPGEGRAQVNNTRLMVKAGVEEKIVSAGVPSSSDATGAVASVMYTITNPGPAPIADYLALVRFIPVGNQTEVVWTVKLTASAKSSTAKLAPVIKKTVGGGLTKFAQAVNGVAARAKL